MQTDAGIYLEHTQCQIAISDWSRVFLKAIVRDEILVFHASGDGRIWHVFPVICDFTKLSADYAGGFTGAFAGLCVQDLRGTRINADFDSFQMQNH